MPGAPTVLRSPVSYAALLVITAGVYFIAGTMSLKLAIPPGYATAVWPPSGIALAAAVLFGSRIWPAIGVGAALVNVGVDSSVSSAVLIAAGNTLEALAARAMMARHVPHPVRFRSPEEVLKFIAVCALGSAIAATFALIPLMLGNPLSWEETIRNWWTWWQGDLSGMIVIAPLILSWSVRESEGWSLHKKLEAASFGLLLLLSAVLLTGGNSTDIVPFSLTFVTLPFIIWGAFRFGQREVSTAIAVVCAIAVWYTIQQTEVSSSVPLNERLLLLLTFVGIVVTTGLTLVAVVGERALAMQALYERQKQVQSSAHYDPLTGLPNEALFRQQLERLLAMGADTGRKVAVAVIDVERFRMINATFGRAGADELLKQIGTRVAADVRGMSIVGRAQGDRFALASEGFTNEGAVARVASKRMQQWFDEPYRLRSNELRLSARMGLALFPDDGDHPDVLYMHAESALKRAKQVSERCVFYTQSMSERAAEKLSLENKLRVALERNEFVLFYQPKLSLQSRAICGVEALMRWQSPDLGLVSPLQFIPILEETGLILDVGRWALRQAVRDQAAWATEGIEIPRVAVNVSSIQLRDSRFVEHVHEAIQPAGSRPLIDLEITESHLMDNVVSTMDKLRQLRAMGIGIAIDDFGTGYSSLAYLAQLPADVVKIDRTFIKRMLDDDHAMTLVQTILSLAASLKLKTVAEGVETNEQADMLAMLGCDEMQGYLVTPPLPRAEATRLLRSAP